MAARGRSYDGVAVVAALQTQWDLLVAAFAGARVSAPSRLPGWDVAALEAHVTGTVTRLLDALASPAPASASVGVNGYYALDFPDVAEPEPGLAGAVARAREALAAAELTRLVGVAGAGLTLTDYLVTRVVEAVVHGRDLPVPAEPAPAALAITVRALVDTFAARHPGRTVELRVPPYAAAQVLPGPAHTRGTPPNVVEADPLAWVEVAAGRAAWGELAAAGRIAASGGRADLSAYLPLL